MAPGRRGCYLFCVAGGRILDRLIASSLGFSLGSLELALACRFRKLLDLGLLALSICSLLTRSDAVTSSSGASFFAKRDICLSPFGVKKDDARAFVLTAAADEALDEALAALLADDAPEAAAMSKAAADLGAGAFDMRACICFFMTQQFRAHGVTVAARSRASDASNARARYRARAPRDSVRRHKGGRQRGPQAYR